MKDRDIITDFKKLLDQITASHTLKNGMIHSCDLQGTLMYIPHDRMDMLGELAGMSESAIRNAKHEN